MNQPEVFLFRELVLQAMVRSHLASPSALAKLLQGTGLAGIDTNSLEILSEKAFPEGHVDLLIKEATPKGLSKKVVVEVKRRKASKTDIDQLGRYRATLGQECVGAVLLTAGSSARITQAAKQAGVEVVNYSIDFPPEPASYDDLLTRFSIS